MSLLYISHANGRRDHFNDKNIVLVFLKGGNNWEIVPGLSALKEIISFGGVCKDVCVSRNLKWYLGHPVCAGRGVPGTNNYP